MKAYLLYLFLILAVIRNTCAQSSNNFFFIAGMPIQQCTQDQTGEVFISEIIQLVDSDNLIKRFTISDSSEVLYSLNYYPEINKIISLSCSKIYDGNNIDNFYKIKEIDVKTLNESNSDRILMSKKNIGNQEYYFYAEPPKIVKYENNLFTTIEYHNPDASIFSKRFALDNPTNFEFGFENLNNAIINGSVAGPFFRANGSILTLYGHPEKRSLIIPSYLKVDSIFHTVIPVNAVLIPKRYSSTVLINNHKIRLLYYREGKDEKPFYDLYNKEQDRYYQYPFDNSNLNVKQFGKWITGPSRLSFVNRGAYQGEQVGQDLWIDKPSKYSLAVREYMHRKMKRTILSGYLAIRSIDDPSIFIEWDTGQGDSEILNIKAPRSANTLHGQPSLSPL